MQIWHELGIPPTRDQRAVKRAYAARLKQTRPEDDPAAFQRLRDAYEAALSHAGLVEDDAYRAEFAQRTWNQAASAPQINVEWQRAALEQDATPDPVTEPTDNSDEPQADDADLEMRSDLEPWLRSGEYSRSYGAKPVQLDDTLEASAPEPDTDGDALDDHHERSESDPNASETTDPGGSSRTVRDPRRDLDPWRRKFADETQARKLVEAFMSAAEGKHAQKVAALLSQTLDQSELLSLALREEFDVQLMRAIYLDRGLSQQFVLGVAQALKWEGDERPAVFAKHEAMADVLARIRAARQYDRLQIRWVESAALLALLDDYKPRGYFWRALDKRTLLRMRDASWELRESMADPRQSFVDPRILDWWERKAQRVNFYWHHVLWAIVLWLVMALSDSQHAFPWNMRGTTALAESSSGRLLLAIALPLGVGAALFYEWALLRWHNRWAQRFLARPLFIYGWPAAIILLAGLAQLDLSSPFPLRWILGPLEGLVLLWALRAIDFRLRFDEAAQLAMVCAAFGFWAWCTIVYSDIVLAMLTGLNVFLLLSQGRAVVADAVEQYASKRSALIWTYGWFVPLLAVVALTSLSPPDAYRNSAWVFTCWVFTIWGMLATPFYIQRCAGCLFYGWMGSVTVAVVLTHGKDESVAVIFSIAFALLVGAYFLIDVIRRGRGVRWVRN